MESLYLHKLSHKLRDDYVAAKSEGESLSIQLQKEGLKARMSQIRVVRERDELKVQRERDELKVQVTALKSDLANTQTRLEEERKKSGSYR